VTEKELTHSIIAGYPGSELLLLDESVDTLDKLLKVAKELGDGFLVYLINEIADEADNQEEVVRRIDRTIADLTSIAFKLQV